MQKNVYEDYKYVMQDTAFLYVGTKYTLDEIIENEEIPFKFRLIVERYFMPEVSGEDTLETHLYYLPKESFHVKILKQIKARAKVLYLKEKKSLGGRLKKEYCTKLMTMDEVVTLTPEQKEQMGMVIQELKMSKLALMGF